VNNILSYLNITNLPNLIVNVAYAHKSWPYPWRKRCNYLYWYILIIIIVEVSTVPVEPHKRKTAAPPPPPPTGAAMQLPSPMRTQPITPHRPAQVEPLRLETCVALQGAYPDRWIGTVRFQKKAQIAEMNIFSRRSLWLFSTLCSVHHMWDPAS
jgi:hypothetical protein